MSDVVIECRNLSKRFRIPQAQYSTLKGRLVRPFARTEHAEFEALDDVSFEVRGGEFFGIVGRNGSGKSTLLKLIAGIYHANSGSLRIIGDIAPFIELGVGFNDELSGRDNVFLNGALLGLSRRQLEQRYAAIVEFAELEDFMDLKLRNFSSGMQVRLAFSIALQAGADILLTDEVLAVGDERFQRKCFDVFREQKRKGQTVVFVSHDMGAIHQFCDRALLLESGRVAAYGPVHEVVRAYHELNRTDGAERVVADKAGGVTMDEVVTMDLSDERATNFGAGETIRVRVSVASEHPLTDPILGLTVRDSHGVRLFASDTHVAGVSLRPIDAGAAAVYEIDVVNRLAGGRYYLAAALSNGTPANVLVQRDDAEFTCDRTDRALGAIDGPFNVRELKTSVSDA